MTDVDWASEKRAAEPALHRRLQAGEQLGGRSGTIRMVQAKLGLM